MVKRVILTLDEGSFDLGFRAILRIEDGATGEIEFKGRLPPAQELVKALNEWQSVYQQMVMVKKADFRIKLKPGQVTAVSCPELGRELQERLNQWLDSGYEEWRRLRDKLQQHLDRNEEIRFIIQTEDLGVQQLPWHLWSLFSQDFQSTEIALAPPEFKPPSSSVSPSNKVRILVILGDSTGIDIKQDKLEFEQLRQRDADPVFLPLPSRKELFKHLREQQWDMLFFAGHSSSSNNRLTGQLQINRDDSLSISELKNALAAAIRRGLQLAIFNSCDGLGLAHELARLHIPQIVVMRQPVPNRVAQDFLKYFLAAFVHRDKSLYLAVREARERIQEEHDDRSPCASWLPIICHNPATEPLTWLLLRRRPQPIGQRLQKALFLSIAVTGVISGVREFGLLQPTELQAFDSLQRLQPARGPDPRLLVVAVTESDIQTHKLSSISDSMLAGLLAKLEQYQPRVIGLDIYRDFLTNSQGADLAPYLHNPRLIAVCRHSAVNQDGIAPPPTISDRRLGFSDVVVDPDGIVRRHLLSMVPVPESPCKTIYAFSLQLAYHYLAIQNIQPQAHPKQYLQIGHTVFKPLLSGQTGGYKKLDFGGHQVLLNYRSSQNIAPIATLSQVLEGKLDPNQVRDRVVLIGVTSANVNNNDVFSTPYTAGIPNQRMPGVLVQAQMVSQILGAVLDGRPSLSVWSTWEEILWIWGWSLVGSAIAWVLRWRLLLRLGLVIVMLGTLSGLCFVLFQRGVWVPLVPSALALAIAGGSIVFAIIPSQNQRQ